MKQGHQLIPIRVRQETSRALVFLHGFIGDSDETWDRFPTILGTETSISDWDILSLGYNTSFLPGTRGIWAADPELPILGKRFCTEVGIPPLSKYKDIAIAAHSMGGLVAQTAVIEDPELVKRVRYLFLFGTPSGGLRKAGIASMLFGALIGVQLHNMASDGEYIKNLRLEWSKTFPNNLPFGFCVIAGDRDQFVPPESSLKPFASKYHRVVTGDHVSMVKPKDKDTDVVRLMVSALAKAREPVAPSSALSLAAETGSMAPEGIEIAEDAAAGRQVDQKRKLNEQEVVQAALALDRDGKRQQAIELLEKYQNLGTDAKGTLAGRIKRRWLQEGNVEDAHWALGLYSHALSLSQQESDIDQIYYHAINVAFLKFAAFDDLKGAQEMARLALESAKARKQDLWSIATQAEAYLYLGDREKATEAYRQARQVKAEPWQYVSAGQQAQYVAQKLGDVSLQEKLKDILDPKPKGTNRIFVSYSHRDRDWLDELKTMLTPFLTERDELDLWDDTKIKPGSRWLDDIRDALATSKVAVLLVSAEFLASDFIRKEELPVILAAVQRGQVGLIWLYISAAAYEVTSLKDYQAAHDLKKPLESLSKPDQREVLKQIAFKIKDAVFALGQTS